jgi:hypothetical protein
MMSDDDRQRMKDWVANWKQTGEELDRRKWEELRAMDAQSRVLLATQALRMADEWRAAQTAPLNRLSGLIEQQFWFAKWPKRSI